MIASALAIRSIAAFNWSEGKPATVALAMSTARGASSMTPAEASVPVSPSNSTVRCAMRSASIRVDDGSPVPALTTISRLGGRAVMPVGDRGPRAASATEPCRPLSPGSACSKLAVSRRQRSPSCRSWWRSRRRVIACATSRPWLRPTVRWARRLPGQSHWHARVVGIIIAPHEPAPRAGQRAATCPAA